MSLSITSLRFPYERLLLSRTKLAYVHLPGVLHDAKRDRSARVSGYVAVWLPEELILLYLVGGELVNASLLTGRGGSVLSLSDAQARIPADPDWGEICVAAAPEEQLGCMHVTHAVSPEPWPLDLDPRDPGALFPYLMASTFDGVVEIRVDSAVNYLLFRDGAVSKAFLEGESAGSLVERVRDVFEQVARDHAGCLRRWPVMPALPAQASPALIRTYRELVERLVHRLLDSGRDTALTIAEHARLTLTSTHPILRDFALNGAQVHEPSAEAGDVTAAIAAWVSEIVWWTGLDHEPGATERLLRELTSERRHMLLAAGFFDKLPWSLESDGR
jgi:hypothetical protein